MSQIERRYLVTDLADGFPNRIRHPYEIIEQGYWDSPEHDILRIRTIMRPGKGPSAGEVVRKFGAGISRDADRKELSDEDARWWLACCPYVLRKNRFRIDGWKLDIFEGPLQGIVVAEKELERADDPVHFPSWIFEAREITDQVNNLYLAKLARVIRGGDDPMRMLESRTRKIPRIVLTGGPCSGKTTVMRALRERFGERGPVHFVPEVATILIGQVGVLPGTGGAAGNRRFQQVVFAAQKQFEDAACEQAVLTDKIAVLQDRGIADGAGYCEGGESEFEEVCNTDLEHERGRYDLVIQLAVPPKAVFEANRANNPARSEDHETAAAIDRRLNVAWCGLRAPANFSYVDNTPTMEEKIARVTSLIEDFLGRA